MRQTNRNANRADRVHTSASGALVRWCPRCRQGPGQKCVRRVSGLVYGEDIGGGGYAVGLKHFHPERKSGPRVRPAEWDEDE